MSKPAMPNNAMARIAELRALLDGEAPVIWLPGTVRRLVDVAEAAIAFVAKCRECDGTGIVWQGPVAGGGHGTGECPVCAPLRAAISKLTGGN